MGVDINISETLHFHDTTVTAQVVGDIIVDLPFTESIFFDEVTAIVLIDPPRLVQVIEELHIRDAVTRTPVIDLAITDFVETYAFEGHSPTAGLHIDEHFEAIECQGLTGEVGQLEIVEPLDIYGHAGETEVLADLVLEEYLSDYAFTGLTGQIGQLAFEEPLDEFLGAAILPAIGQMAFTEPLEDYWLHGYGLEISAWKAVVMNVNNHAVSEYKNFDFNSIVYFNGVFLGLNETGVYLLGGDDDLGQYIQARIKSGLEDFGKKVITIPREAWMVYRSNNGNGALELDVKIDEKTDLFPARFDGRITVGEQRRKLGRGIKARFFTWDLKNISGSKLSLESLRILGDVIKRKTR